MNGPIIHHSSHIAHFAEAAGVLVSEATTGRPLAGRSIVVTRPAHQAQAFARLIDDAGGHSILFPAIEIRDAANLGPFLSLVDRLDEFDLAIFISPNAVERAMSLIAGRRGLPPGLRIATIGSGGVRSLSARGVTGVISPRGRYDSEALLELPEIAGAKRVVIFRGEGGREHLGEALVARGVKVEYGECYRREKPRLDPVPLLEGWSRNDIDAVTVTSSEGLRNLCAMVGAAGLEPLKRTPLFVPHPRIAEAARSLEVRTVVITGPGDNGLIEGLVTFFSASHRST